MEALFRTAMPLVLLMVDNDLAGGLVGRNDGTIQGSYATGAVKIDAFAAGGLVGVNAGTTQNNYATGAVSGGIGGSNSYVGGLVGLNNVSRAVVQNSYYATGVAVKGGAGAGDYVGGLVGLNFGIVKNNYALGAVTGGNGDYVGRIVGKSETQGAIFGNYALTSSTLAGENKRTIAIGEVVLKTTAGELKALTAAITETDFTSGDTTDGWSTNSWDFTAGKYPSLKSYKTNASDEQIEGELLCGQGTDWVEC